MTSDNALPPPAISTNGLLMNYGGGEASFTVLDNVAAGVPVMRFQTTTGGLQQEAMVITANGNVGIKTTPAVFANLHVSAGPGNDAFVLIEGENGVNALRIARDATGTNGLDIAQGDSINPAVFFNRENQAATIPAFQFIARPGGIDQTLMTLRAGGNVGIGTASPTHRLHINGGLRIQGATPTIGSGCGTGASLLAGSNNSVGRLSIGTGSGICILSFGSPNPFTATPVCTATPQTIGCGPTPLIASVSGTTSVLFAQQSGTALGSNCSINYMCVQP